MMQSQLATLVASRPSQVNIYIRPFWSDFLIPSCIFYLHANYTTVINPISNICMVSTGSLPVPFLCPHLLLLPLHQALTVTLRLLCPY
jgi:hypothetical protein